MTNQPKEVNTSANADWLDSDSIETLLNDLEEFALTGAEFQRTLTRARLKASIRAHVKEIRDESGKE